MINSCLETGSNVSAQKLGCSGLLPHLQFPLEHIQETNFCSYPFFFCGVTFKRHNLLQFFWQNLSKKLLFLDCSSISG